MSCTVLQVVEGCLRFASLAEAFTGTHMPTREAYMHILGAFVRGSHKSNMQGLKQALAGEAWGAAAGSTARSSSSTSTPGASCVLQSLSNTMFAIPALGEAGFVSDFADWVKCGNPFRKQGRAVGGEAVLWVVVLCSADITALAPHLMRARLTVHCLALTRFCWPMLTHTVVCVHELQAEA